VFTALVLLVILIVLSPATLFADGTMTGGIVALIVAVALWIVSAGVRPGEAGHLAKVVRPALLLMALPALWVLVQLFPMPFKSLSHPVWTSTAEALNMPVSGHISIDLGSTLIGLVGYLTAAGILIVATTVTIDRARAEWLLYWLTGTTAFLAALLIAETLVGPFLIVGSRATATLWAASALGAIIAAAATVRSVERYETRRNKAEMTRAKFAWSLIASVSALAVCWIALLIAAPIQVTFAAGCGTATVGIIVIMRRFALERFAVGVLATVAIIAAIAIAAAGSNPGGRDPALRFAAEASPSAVSIAERMIADNPVGTGFGTFRSLLPIYRSIDDVNGPDWAPTTAAQIMIEMGRPALWIFVLMMILATRLLSRGAANRGRDSFYAAGAAGCAITLTVEAFVDASLTGTAIVILAMAILGLGLAQSASRTVP
jgi:hypothetical protein